MSVNGNTTRTLSSTPSFLLETIRPILLESSLVDSWKTKLQVVEDSSSNNEEWILTPLEVHDWNTLSTTTDTTRNQQGSSKSNVGPTIPYSFGIGIQNVETKEWIGWATLYLGYSTWDGRCLFVDQLQCPSLPSSTTTTNEVKQGLEQDLLRLLAKIALALHCRRLCWETNTKAIPSWYLAETGLSSKLNPEILKDWYLLRMERDAMVQYCKNDPNLVGEDGSTASSMDKPSSPSSLSTCLTRSQVDLVMEHWLGRLNASLGKEGTKHSFSMRLGKPATTAPTSELTDTQHMERMVRGLAAYEGEPDAVQTTYEEFDKDCGGGGGGDVPGEMEEPMFYCILLEDATIPEDAPKQPCGMALIYFGYTVEHGRFLYLEDLYLEENYRKRGGGSLVMRTLARIALSLDCAQFRWVALDWNTPALNLYQKIGARIVPDTVIARFTHANLAAFAEDDSKETTKS